MSTDNRSPLPTSAAKADSRFTEGPEEIRDGAPRGTLTRQDIALALYNRLGGMSRREAKRIVDSVIDEMVSTITGGESLKLHDFGSFIVRGKNERAGRNPRTGAPVPIDARRVVVFKASPNMKAAINGRSPPRRGAKAAARRLAETKMSDPQGVDALVD